MLHRKSLRAIVAVMVLLSALVLPASASPSAAGSGITSASWVVYQPWRGQDWIYGVFITPVGARNLSLVYRLSNGSLYSLSGGNQCRLDAVVGPGYIKDPNAGRSAYVPKGYIGMAICASTKQALFLTGIGQKMKDNTRWLLYYLL